jgi:hypothetical protein
MRVEIVLLDCGLGVTSVTVEVVIKMMLGLGVRDSEEGALVEVVSMTRVEDVVIELELLVMGKTSDRVVEVKGAGSTVNSAVEVVGVGVCCGARTGAPGMGKMASGESPVRYSEPHLIFSQAPEKLPPGELAQFH